MNSFGEAMQAVPHNAMPQPRWRSAMDRYIARLAELRTGAEEAQH